MNTYDGAVWENAGPEDRAKLMFPFGALVQVAYAETLQEAGTASVSRAIARQNLIDSEALGGKRPLSTHELSPAGRFLLHLGSTVADLTTDRYQDLFTPEQMAWIQNGNVYFKDNHHREFTSSAFAALGYMVMFVDTATQYTNFRKQRSTELGETINTDWFVDLEREAAAAPMSYWSIPPYGRKAPYIDRIAQHARAKAGKLRYKFGASPLAKRGEEGWGLSSAVALDIEDERIKRGQFSREGEVTASTPTSWYSSSGCPVRHDRLAQLKLERTLTAEQMARILDSKLYKAKDRKLMLLKDPYARTSQVAGKLLTVSSKIFESVQKEVDAAAKP